MSRWSAYEAAKEGHLPLLKLGERRTVVPREALRRMLNGEPVETEAA
jgi:hypothetical protein